MAHLIVKDRKLCMVNGRFVTSANGAPCVCGGGGGGELDCDIPELPCSANILVQGVTAQSPVFGVDQRIDVLAFSGFNGVHKVSLDGSQPDLGFLTVHVVLRITRLSNPSEQVTLTFNQAVISGGQIICVNDRLCLAGGSMGFGNAIAASIVDESEGFWTWSAQGFLDVGGGGSDVVTASTNDDPPRPLCIGSTWPTLRPPDPDTLLGERQATISLVGWGFDCPPDEQSQTVRLAYPCDDGDPIPVDLATNIDAKWNAKKDGVIYIVSDEATNDPPISVEWVDEECGDNPDLGDVFERCTPRDDGLPDRVRVGAAMDGYNFGRIRTVTPDPSVQYPNCQTIRIIGYRRIEDDGGTYPDAPNMAPSAGPCSNIRDYTQRQFCGPSDSGDPQDPNNPAITDPGIQRTLPIQDLSGYDIEREINAARQGGCCGSPTK